MTIFAASASAQTYTFGPASSPSPAGNATSSDSSGTSSPPLGESDPSQAPAGATLLGVPVYGTAPFTVNFYVALANPPASLVYQWNFGDGAVSSLPASVYILHVYQRPGSYLCSLNLTNAQGQSTTVFTTITVKPGHS